MNGKEDILLMEYKETVTTLRNWDTLFVNLLISSIVVGGIGGGLAFVKGSSTEDNIVLTINNLVLIMSFLVGFIIIGYVYYALTVAKHKMNVLKSIELELRMHGAYRYSGLQKGFFKVVYATGICYFIGLGNFILRHSQEMANYLTTIIIITGIVIVLLLVVYQQDWKNVKKKKLALDTRKKA